MKKIFWTSIVWIVLICGFTLYMKWFGQPLAHDVANFIYPDCGAECDCDCDCEDYVCSEAIISCDECAEWMECPDVEPAVCNCPSQILATWDESANWNNLFDELDQIKVLIKSNNNSETLNEKTDEELFEEFKEWKAKYYNN